MSRPKPSSLPRPRASKWLGGFVSYFCLFALTGTARNSWSELNIGPFLVDTQGDLGQAREVLTQLEQLRWVLGGLLESKDLPSLWPIRVLLTPSGTGQFVSQNGQYILTCRSAGQLPLDRIAAILIESNTPRLPPEVDSGLAKLLSTIDAHGSHVTWGGPVPKPDLGWSRMQLFATKPEYTARLPIFIGNLRSGSTLSTAESNAFGKPKSVLEDEVARNLAAGTWQAVPVSGRPLDPKRDFGEHSLNAAVASVYLADVEFAANPKAAEAAYKTAVEAGGEAAALGHEGLARLAVQDKQDPAADLQSAIDAGSRSAPVYVAAAKGLDALEAAPLLKKAAFLNPRWGQPVFEQAQLATEVAERESLLKRATELDPRSTEFWEVLAETQMESGHITAAQGSWLRAENSAAADGERDRIHQRRLDYEEHRLDALEAERRRTRESAHADDQRAQNAETARIKAAEERANARIDAEAGTNKPAETVPWTDDPAGQKLNGALLKVDCLRGSARLSIKTASGKTVQLLVKDPAHLSAAGATTLSCGLQQPPKSVLIGYAARADKQFGTSGDVLSLRFE